MTRNYDKEYANYQGSDEQKKNRAQRNKARRLMVREGRAAKGDGKDVDHIMPLRSGGTSTKSNLRIRSKSANRSDK
jgi:polyphosphate kinase 2 (PPK2 family)